MPLKVIGGDAKSQDLNDNFSYLDTKQPEILDNSLPSSKLKIATDEDRLQLENLSEEVLQAMAGTTPINMTPADLSVTKAKVVPNTIDADLLRMPNGFLISGATGRIIYDQTLQTVTTTGALYLLHENKYYTLPSSGSFLATEPGTSTALKYLWYNPTNNTLGVSLVPGASVPESAFVIAYILGEEMLVNGDSSRVWYITPSGRNVYTKVTYGEIQGEHVIKVDFETRELEVEKTCYIMAGGLLKGTLSVGHTVPIDASILVDGLKSIYYSPTQGLGVSLYTKGLPRDAVLLGTHLRLSGQPHVLSAINPRAFKVITPDGRNMAATSISDLSLTAYPAGVNEIEINLQTKQATFNQALLMMGTEYKYTANPQVVDMTAKLAENTYIKYFYYDFVLGQVVFTDVLEGPRNRHWVICYLDQTKDKLYSLNPGAFTFYDSNGELVDDTGDVEFVDTTQRMVMADKMYFAEGEELPLYKHSIFSTTNDRLLNLLKTSLITTLNDVPRYRSLNDDIVVAPEELDAQFWVGFAQNESPDYNYLMSLEKRVAQSGAISGQTIKFLNFGDSLTEGNISYDLKNRLESKGATAVSLGTYSSSYGTNTPTEGRGFWAYRAFIGKTNNIGGQVITLATPPAPTGKFENPFLRLATTDDKTNNPDWCFRNTGAVVELSYTEDVDKTGDFYIFDFGAYLTNYGIDTPDIVTIGLSTNDINLDRAAYTEQEAVDLCLLGMEVMISSIRAAAPNCKIGIIPSPAWGANELGNTRWSGVVTDWIEEAMAKVEALDTTYGEVYTVPVWQHMNRDWNFHVYTGTQLSANNKTIKSQQTDVVHFGDTYKWQNYEYISVMSNWIRWLYNI